MSGVGNWVKTWYDAGGEAFQLTVSIGGSSKSVKVPHSIVVGTTYRAQVEVCAAYLQLTIVDVTNDVLIGTASATMTLDWSDSGLDVEHWYLGADETAANQGHLYISEATS